MDAHSGRIVYVNNAIRLLTRRGVSDFLAQPKLWRSMVHPDDRAAMRSAGQRLLHEGKVTHEFRLVLADGEERTVESSARVRYDAAGKPVYIDGSIVDITARKLAEEAVIKERALLRAVVDAIPERIYVKDRQGHFLLQNLTNAKARSSGNADAIMGKTVFDLFPPEIAQRMHAEDGLVMSSGRPMLDREGRTLYRDAGIAQQQLSLIHI